MFTSTMVLKEKPCDHLKFWVDLFPGLWTFLFFIKYSTVFLSVLQSVSTSQKEHLKDHHLINVLNLKILVEPVIKTYTKIIDGRPVEVTEKKVTEERIIQGKLSWDINS